MGRTKKDVIVKTRQTGRGAMAIAKAAGIKAAKMAEKNKEKRGAKAQNGSDDELLVQDPKKKKF